jgi:hypothetical protein
MTRQKPSGGASGGHEIEEVLRLPDGSVDIAAYAKIAHRQRAEAIVYSMRETIGRARGMLSAMGARLATVVRSRPASGKHHAPLAR